MPCLFFPYRQTATMSCQVDYIRFPAGVHGCDLKFRIRKKYKLT